LSPDGSRIAFVRDYDIWVVDSDGNNPRLLADVADWRPAPGASNWSVGATSVSWSPDGEELVYGLSRIGGSGLGYVEKLSLKTGERRRLHNESALFLVPNLLPGGSVVLSRNRDELELLQPDGSTLAPVQFLSSQNWPSPGYATGDAKGHWLVGSFGREAPILYGESKAMNQVALGVSPALAPRADWIAYFSGDSIRLVRVDGGE
jgi:dipeptidyl aminopeptidase/acylaminoacyl peptidase